MFAVKQAKGINIMYFNIMNDEPSVPFIYPANTSFE